VKLRGVAECGASRRPCREIVEEVVQEEEFFFRLPFHVMDRLWWAQERKVPIEKVAAEAGLTVEQVRRAFRDFDRKRRTTEYLRMAPIALGSG
jgi:NAD+ synthase